MTFELEGRRRFARFPLQAWVGCPALSGEPFPVVDISAGGFEASLPREPLEGVPYRVTLRVGDSLFGPLNAFVVWCREDGRRSAAWSFGMLVAMRDERREQLSAVLERMMEAACA